MKNQNSMKWLLLAGSMILLFSFCRKDPFYSGTAVLEFSADTLTFDTVFTTLSSATRSFKIYNPYGERLLLSSVKLKGLSAANFDLNVDGVSGDEVHDVEIEPHDSVYVFVEVNVDPTNSNTPLIIVDEVEVTCNANTQSIFLMAWGQDAYFHYGEVIRNNQTWPSDKPHVLIGKYNDTLDEYIPGVKVQNGTLTISAGARVYSFTNGGILVDAAGRLICDGTATDSIKFEGHRLEPFFDELSGQWFGIFILRGSTGNVIKHTIITESSYGINVGSLLGGAVTLADFTNATRPDVSITHSAVRNSFYYSLFAINARVDAVNSVFSHNSDAAIGSSRSNMLTLTLGGEYNFTHCTIYNSGSNSDHQAQTLLMSNVASDNTAVYVNALDATFTNTIVYGTLDDEVKLSVDASDSFNYTFSNCLLKTEINPDTIHAPSSITAEILNLDPLFESAFDYNFQLKDGSPCIDAGTAGTADDFFERPRPAGAAADIGAFEKQ